MAICAGRGRGCSTSAPGNGFAPETLLGGICGLDRPAESPGGHHDRRSTLKNTKRAPALTVALGLVAIVVTSFLGFLTTHRSSRAVSRKAADREIEQLRSRLTSEIRRGAPEANLAGATVAAPRVSPGPVHAIHTVIFDTRGGDRLVRTDAPLWWVRATTRRGVIRWLGQLTFFDDTEFDGDPVDLSLHRIGEQGPALLADVHHADGGWLVSWSE